MLTREQILHIAKLAKLELTESEIEKFQKQLSDVIEYFEILKSIDTSHISPKTHTIELTNRFEQKKIGESTLKRSEALKNAKEKTDKYFVTDAVL